MPQKTSRYHPQQALAEGHPQIPPLQVTCGDMKDKLLSLICKSCTCFLHMYDFPFHSSRSTAHLESFQNHVLMYASKRQELLSESLTTRVYESRVLHATLDYNFHRERPTYRTATGQQMQVKLYLQVTMSYSNKCIFRNLGLLGQCPNLPLLDLVYYFNGYKRKLY